MKNRYLNSNKIKERYDVVSKELKDRINNFESRLDDYSVCDEKNYSCYDQDYDSKSNNFGRTASTPNLLKLSKKASSTHYNNFERNNKIFSESFNSNSRRGVSYNLNNKLNNEGKKLVHQHNINTHKDNEQLNLTNKSASLVNNNNDSEVNIHAINRKFSILFREISEMKESKSQVSIVNNSLLETRKLIFILKDQLEKQLKDFEVLMYSNLELDLNSNEINLIPDTNLLSNYLNNENQSASISNKLSEVKKRKKEIVENLITTTNSNSNSIQQLKESIAAFKETFLSDNQFVEGSYKQLSEKTANLESKSSILEKTSSSLEIKLANLEEKHKKQIEYYEKSNKELLSKILNLEDKLNSKIVKIEENHVNDLSVVEEKLNENVNNSRVNVEEKLTKQTKKELDSLKSNIINEISYSLWDKKKTEINKEVEKSIKETEIKLNNELKDSLNSLQINLDDQIIKVKELLNKLEQDQKTLSSGVESISKNLSNKLKYSNFNNNLLVNNKPMSISNLSNSNLNPNLGVNSSRFGGETAIEQNNPFNYSNNKKLGNSISNSIKQYSTHEKDLKIATKISPRKIKKDKIEEYLVSDSEEEDDDIYFNQSKGVNESTRSKKLFNRVTTSI